MKIYCIGEVLIDFVSKEKQGLKNALSFEKKAGGAPANVACTIVKMGKQAEFMGKIGADFFGEYLSDILRHYKIKTTLCQYGGNTTLAFVALDEDGERNFSFNRGSDESYDYTKIDLTKITSKDILHFGSATALLGGKLKESYFKIFEYAKQNGIFISFDPNYRENLISKDILNQYIEECKTFIRNSNFIKMSDEEAKIITQEEDLKKSVDTLHKLGAKIVTITLGKDGTILSFKDNYEIIPSIKINQVDSTGAGDAFVGSMLSLMIEEINSGNDLSFEKIKEICIFSNKVGAITCTNYGAMNSIPTKKELGNI